VLRVGKQAHEAPGEFLRNRLGNLIGQIESLILFAPRTDEVTFFAITMSGAVRGFHGHGERVWRSRISLYERPQGGETIVDKKAHCILVRAAQANA
jgi:hypothetical protein